MSFRHSKVNRKAIDKLMMKSKRNRHTNCKRRTAYRLFRKD